MEKFVSATSFLPVHVQPIIGGGLVIGRVTPLQEKRGGHVLSHSLTERAALHRRQGGQKERM